MFLLTLINIVSENGVEYTANDYKILERITRNDILPTFEIRSEVEEIKAGSTTNSAFFLCSAKIGEVTFATGSNLQKIGDYLFASTSITSCDMSNCRKLLELSNNAFYQCRKLEKLILPPNMEVIGKNCIVNTLLKEIDIPDSVITISGYDMFGTLASNSKLTSVHISEKSNLQSLGSHCFMDCALESFYIPRNLSSIGAGPFLNCKIMKITCHPENKYFTISDDCITVFSDNNTIMCLVANGLECDYTIAPTVTSFSSQVFRGSQFSSIKFTKMVPLNNYIFGETKFKTIELPEGLNDIPAYCFQLSQLTDIKLPSSIKILTSLQNLRNT